MSDLQDALDKIKARAENAKETPPYEYTLDRVDELERSQADVPRLVAAVEAVLKEAKDADKQDRLISPDILRKRLADKLTGERAS